MSKVNDYYKHCGTCTNYMLGSQANMGRTRSLASYSGVGFRCTRFGQNFVLSDSCRNYSYNRRVSDKDLFDAEKMIKNSKIRFYVVTAVMNIINNPDFNELSNQLKEFRVNYMEKDSRYDGFLAVYDEVGPVLAQKIYEDEKKEEVANTLLYDYLLPIGVNIEYGDTLKNSEFHIQDEKNIEYERSAGAFMRMIDELMKTYNIRPKVSEDVLTRKKTKDHE